MYLYNVSICGCPPWTLEQYQYAKMMCFLLSLFCLWNSNSALFKSVIAPTAIDFRPIDVSNFQVVNSIMLPLFKPKCWLNYSINRTTTSKPFWTKLNWCECMVVMGTEYYPHMQTMLRMEHFTHITDLMSLTWFCRGEWSVSDRLLPPHSVYCLFWVTKPVKFL